MSPTRRHPSLEDRCKRTLELSHEDSSIYIIAEGCTELIKKVKQLEKDALFYKQQGYKLNEP